MSIKIILYLVVTPFVILALDSLNINQIFKKNQVFKSRLFFFLITIALIYLVANFIFDFTTLSKIV